MRKYLLPKDGNFYKANLHCHSTVSDGLLSPKELKQAYINQGYSVIAYTDHNLLLDQNKELSDESFLALNGFEADASELLGGEITEPADRKTCHLCFIAKDPDNLTHPFWHRSKYLFGGANDYKHLAKFDESKEDYERSYTPECINEMIALGKESGFFVTYNHPTWSLEGYLQYSSYEGMDAMEIFNYSCYVAGYPEYNPRVYDDLLRQNKRIFCVATDDNHNRSKDSFGGFVMIKAEKLDYKSITQALENGDFYASQGPIIKSIWYEDQKICVECEGAQRIQLNTGITLAHSKRAKDGEPLTYAEFELDPTCIYVRVTVVGENGKKACSNAYFIDQIINTEA